MRWQEVRIRKNLFWFLLTFAAPDFVKMLEDDDYVYFFLREQAVEYINCGKVKHNGFAHCFINSLKEWYINIDGQDKQSKDLMESKQAYTILQGYSRSQPQPILTSNVKRFSWYKLRLVGFVSSCSSSYPHLTSIPQFLYYEGYERDKFSVLFVSLIN